MLSEREVSAAVGGTAYGTDGDKLGTVEAFFVDDRTGAPSWVTVSTGLFGTRHSVVPAVDATYADGALRVPVTAEAVKSAPQMAGEHLDLADEEALRRHYGLGGSESVADAKAGDVAEEAAPTIPVQTVSRTDEPAATDGAMTRGEEQLRVGTERVAATRVRLVKYVVTEDVQITVPIRREEIRVEEVPLDAPDDVGESLEVPAAGTGRPEGLPDEIVLHTERPVVTVEVVPVERVRLRTELVQGQETVTEQVQREQIVVDETPSPRLSAR